MKNQLQKRVIVADVCNWSTVCLIVGLPWQRPILFWTLSSQSLLSSYLKSLLPLFILVSNFTQYCTDYKHGGWWKELDRVSIVKVVFIGERALTDFERTIGYLKGKDFTHYFGKFISGREFSVCWFWPSFQDNDLLNTRVWC